MTMRAAGRPSAPTVASVIAVELRTARAASASHTATSGSGPTGSVAGSGGTAGILSRARRGHEPGRPPSGVCALAGMIDARCRGQGMSPAAVRAMVDLARAHGVATLLAPVRPADKSAYPLTPMERYAHWENDDGLPLDRWIRVHARMGAELLSVAPRTLLITGS